MHSPTLQRVVAKVRALLEHHWHGRAGERFRHTTEALSTAVKSLADPEDIPDIAAEAVRRYSVGMVSRDHAEALKNYAEAEEVKIRTALSQAQFTDQVRFQKASADKQEAELRLLKTTELQARLQLFDEFQKRNAVVIWDNRGNMMITKAPPQFDWEEARDRILGIEEIDLALPSASGTGSQPPVATKPKKRRKKRRHR